MYQVIFRFKPIKPRYIGQLIAQIGLLVKTTKDIAKAVGVAPSTVARSLLDSPHIAEGVTSRVRSAAEKLGYIPHSGARLMRSGLTR